MKLEGDIVGSFRRGRIRALAKKTDLTGYDFGAVALATAVLRFVLTGGEAALDVDLPAFVQKALAYIGQLSEGDDAVPFGAFLLRAVAVGRPLRSRQLEIRYVLP